MSERVIVVGGGVVGMSSALALHQAGAEVLLLSATSVGTGASATNVGLLVPADSMVWSSPANRRASPKIVLGCGGAAIAVHWGNPAVIGWGSRFLLRANAKQFSSSSQITHGLSTYSMNVLTAWKTELDLEFGLEKNGLAYLFGTAAAREASRRSHAPLVEAGEQYSEVDGADLSRIDPAFGPATASLKALYAPKAGHADAVAFCRALSTHLVAEGVAVHTDSPVEQIEREGTRITGVRTASDTIEADRVVLAAGHHTARLARQLGIRTGILPVKGTAATVPIIRPEDPELVPAVGGVFEDAHVAFSRTEQHLRLSTGAEIGNANPSVSQSSRAHLREAGDKLFPEAVRWSEARFESGFRPMTAHGLPLIGPTRVSGL